MYFLVTGFELFAKNRVEPLKKEFNLKLSTILSRKKNNSAYYMTRERYQDFINEVKVLKSKQNKEFYDFKTLANYDAINVNSKERLIKPKTEVNESIKFYVSTDELFGVLHTMHLLLKHPGLDVMDSEIKTKYCNVSKEIIKMYLGICTSCSNKF